MTPAGIESATFRFVHLYVCVLIFFFVCVLILFVLSEEYKYITYPFEVVFLGLDSEMYLMVYK